MTEKNQKDGTSQQETLAKGQHWKFHVHASFYFSHTNGSFNQTPDYAEGPNVSSDIQTLTDTQG